MLIGSNFQYGFVVMVRQVYSMIEKEDDFVTAWKSIDLIFTKHRVAIIQGPVLVFCSAVGKI